MRYRNVAWLSLVFLVVLACGSPGAPTVPTTPIVVDKAPVSSSTPIARGPIAPDGPRRVAGDPNPPGTTLNPEAVFVDPSPPDEWTQCAGFVNTADDDVTADFLDNCLGSERLRVRVFRADDALEEDVFVTDIKPGPEWGQGYLGTKGTIVKHTFWGTLDGGAASVLYAGAAGKDACFQASAPGGTTLGSGHAEKAIIAGGNRGYSEYRVSCGKGDLPDRKIAIYR